MHGKYTGEARFVKKTLAKIKIVRNIPQILDSYQAQWLDDDTKLDVVFYFPGRDRYDVFRKILSNDKYEVWGLRQNINYQQIEEMLRQKKPGNVEIFQLAPSPSRI